MLSDLSASGAFVFIVLFFSVFVSSFSCFLSFSLSFSSVSPSVYKVSGCLSERSSTVQGFTFDGNSQCYSVFTCSEGFEHPKVRRPLELANKS